MLIDERCAKLHDMWMAYERAHGIFSLLAADGEELMQPYERLSEREKELQRFTLRALDWAVSNNADR